MAGFTARTKEQLASEALILLGEGTITDFADGSAAGTALTAVYQRNYEEFLTCHEWSFALKDAALVVDSGTTPEDGRWSTVFDLPSDLLLLKYVYPNSDFDIYGTKLYTAQSALDIIYIYAAAVSTLPAYAQSALVYKLAAELAIPVTEDVSKAEFYAVAAKEKLSEARHLDARQRPNIAIKHDAGLITSRYGGGFIGPDWP